MVDQAVGIFQVATLDIMYEAVGSLYWITFGDNMYLDGQASLDSYSHLSNNHGG